jgi:hypothetical protein
MAQAELEGRAAIQGLAEADVPGVPAQPEPASAASGEGRASNEEKREEEGSGEALEGQRSEEPADDIDMEAANQAP